jgi:hypothetical protein
MKISEKELENLIFNLDVNVIREKGLYMPYIKKRQLRIANYGIADIVGIEKGILNQNVKIKPRVYIYELKVGLIDYKTFLQLSRYALGVKKYLHLKNLDYNISIIMVGSKVNVNQISCVYELFNSLNIFIEAYTYELNLDKTLHKFKYQNLQTNTSFFKETISDNLFNEF